VLKTFSGRRASQNEEELRGFIALLQAEGVESYCEIGARHGDTFHEVMLNLAPNALGIAVDYPGALWGTEKSRAPLRAAVADLMQRGRMCRAIFGDSTSQSVLDQLDDHGPFGAILIDGDHTLEGVTKDWQNLHHLAPLVAFHDIVGTGEIEKVGGRPVEVPLLWARLKNEFPHREFIAAGSTMGIGVLWTGR
jgi:hypothetical protein